MKLHCKAHSLLSRHRPTLINDHRSRAIFDSNLKWVSGTTLTFSFLGGSNSFKDALRNAFARWMQYADIRFTEVAKSGQIRIAFENDGSWSYLGRDILDVPAGEPTMNIGWSPVSDFDMALHEVGHGGLALHHEHQNGGIDWNREAVIEELSGAPNFWDITTIERNVLDAIPREQVIGSEVFDDNSIMMYPIPAAWIKSGAYSRTGINPAGGISVGDQYWAGIVYAKASAPDDPQHIVDAPLEVKLYLARGKQASIRWQAKEKGSYRITTTGIADTVAVLFVDGKQVAADDDSGEDRNALIEAELSPESLNEIVVRLYYKNRASELGIRIERI